MTVTHMDVLAGPPTWYWIANRGSFSLRKLSPSQYKRFALFTALGGVDFFQVFLFISSHTLYIPHTDMQYLDYI